jgi:hypothetical protein
MAGYIYNVPGDVVPFRGTISASAAVRVAKGLRVGPSLGYVVAASSRAPVAGGQVTYALLAYQEVITMELSGRLSSSLGRTRMVPLSAGVVATFLGVRSGLFATRDLRLDQTSLELVLGLEPITFAKVLKSIGAGKRVLVL